MNPTILVLQFSEFSMIFYTFYKILQSCNTIEDGILHRNPCKESRLCNWVPRPWEAARLRPIPASRRRSRPGKRWGVTVGSPRVDGWSECERGSLRRWRAAAAGVGTRAGRRWEGNAVQWVAAQASVATREQACGVGCTGGRAGR
jgi:hypothetical protein